MYGIEAVIPVEVGVTNMRMEFFDKEGNVDHLKMNLDCLDEVKSEVSQRIAKYNQRIEDG